MEIPIALMFVIALIWGTSKPLDKGESIETTAKACLICVETNTEHSESHEVKHE